jgi:hypothetical protein
MFLARPSCDRPPDCCLRGGLDRHRNARAAMVTPDQEKQATTPLPVRKDYMRAVKQLSCSAVADPVHPHLINVQIIERKVRHRGH